MLNFVSKRDIKKGNMSQVSMSAKAALIFLRVETFIEINQSYKQWIWLTLM